MSATLLIVHGRGFQPAADVVLELSVEALRLGIGRDLPDKLGDFERMDKDLVYYGDLSNALLRERGQTFDEALDIGDRRNVLAELALLRKRSKFTRARYDHLPKKTPLKELAADLAAAVGLSEQLLARVAPEYAAYWAEASPFRDTLQQRLRSALQRAFDRSGIVIVVSHCLGSVAAFDSFWSLSRRSPVPSPKIDTWITLGSPLGDEAVKRHLAGAGLPGGERYPDNIITWCNLAAEDDYFCHDKCVKNDFSKMLDERLISRIRDYLVYNLAVRFGGSDPHDLLGYLAHPRTAAIIAARLQSSP